MNNSVDPFHAGSSQKPRTISKVRYVTRRVVERPQSPVYSPIVYQNEANPFYQGNVQQQTKDMVYQDVDNIPYYIVPVMYVDQAGYSKEPLPFNTHQENMRPLSSRESFQTPYCPHHNPNRVPYNYSPEIYADKEIDHNSRYYYVPRVEPQQQPLTDDFVYINADFDTTSNYSDHLTYPVEPMLEYSPEMYAEMPVKEPKIYTRNVLKKKTESKRKTSRGSQASLDETWIQNSMLDSKSSPFECRSTQTFKEVGEKKLSTMSTQTTKTKSRLGLFSCMMGPSEILEEQSEQDMMPKDVPKVTKENEETNKKSKSRKSKLPVSKTG